ncbi:cysteine desulfurase family protein [Falsibacillus pallidus]|uniref:cysteine desulfurase n=1 Tax=Falsibacillus pallidus TaxID=493781 RepID=A0A370GKC6_9BACI|nr:cysteine desulfurase family protein [Falsibacillus pallidus]RDI44097.1 cysteine desulfurase [Falsibacillus pallidus]
MERIYLDHAATSPVHPQVAEKMVKLLNEQYGNPSSIHSFGREARQILDSARTLLAKSINASFNEIIFTSGGTEADNMAIIGAAHAAKDKGMHIITSSIEHHAVLHACHALESEGFQVTYLPVDEKGLVNPEVVRQALTDETTVVSIMYGNNEVGTIQPIAEIADILKEHQAVFHTDAVQAYGIENLDVKQIGVDLLSVSSHKINGPKGIGFLYAREGVKVKPRMHGGEQEKKRRAGTENVSSIGAFAEAVKIAEETKEERREKYLGFKKKFIEILTQHEVYFVVNGFVDEALPHVLNLSFAGTDVEAMLVNLDLSGVAASSGSACTAGSIEPSHVLVAMFGNDSDRLRNSIRFSFGLNNTEEQIEMAAEKTAAIVNRLAKQ